jgi:hypothetical protein
VFLQHDIIELSTQWIDGQSGAHGAHGFWPMTLGRLLSNLVNVSRTNVTTYMGSRTNDTPIISRTSSVSN